MNNIKSPDTIFLQLTSMILSHKGVETVLDFIVRECLNCIDAQRINIFQMDGKNEIIKTQFTQASRTENPTVGLFEEKEVARKVFKEEKSYFLKEQGDFSELFKYGRGEKKITSLMAVPLSFKDTNIPPISLKNLYNRLLAAKDIG